MNFKLIQKFSLLTALILLTVVLIITSYNSPDRVTFWGGLNGDPSERYFEAAELMEKGLWKVRFVEVRSV